MKLSDIPKGKRAIVVGLNSTDLRVKLMEMGIMEGRELEVLHIAPFGDPIAVEVDGYTLALRLDEAALIDVNEINTAQ